MKSEERLSLWKSPSGRLHRFRRCSGAGPVKRVLPVRITEAAFWELPAPKRCPCLRALERRLKGEDL